MTTQHLDSLNKDQKKLTPKLAFSRITHSSMPHINLYNTDGGIEFKEFPLKCGYPQPIHMEDLENTSTINQPFILCQQKDSCKQRLSHVKNNFVGKKGGKIKNKNFAPQLGRNVYSANFPLFMELLNLDPDKYFDGPYDWYYTGGSLELVMRDNNIILFNATGHQLDKLRVSQQRDKCTEIYDLSKNNSIIYETCRHNEYYAVRQKNHITVFNHVQNHGLIKLNEMFAIESDVPFLSSTFVTDSKMITIDAKQAVKEWDIDTSTNLSNSYNVNIKNKVDNWGIVKKFNDNLFLYANRSELNLMDFRIPNYRTIGTYLYKNMMDCNKIYCIENSKFDNLVYVSTNHSLYGLDIRYMNDSDLTMNTVVKWTHLMKMPAIMINTLCHGDDNEEFIYLSSSLNDDKKICVNRKSSVYNSPYLPYKPKSIIDTYHTAQLEGKCINPLSDFDERINLCTTGIRFFTEYNHLYTVWSNSGGDIFYQKFVEYECGMPRTTLANMEKWVDQLQNTTCHKITNLDCMNSILLALQCKNLNEIKTDNSTEPEDRPLPIRKWQRSINELYQYKDILVENILDAWDLKQPIMEDLKDDTQMDTHINMSDLPYSSKIDDWFLRNTDIKPSIVKDEQIDLVDESNLELSNTLEMTADNMIDEFTETLFNKQSTKILRPKRKSRHVDGF